MTVNPDDASWDEREYPIPETDETRPQPTRTPPECKDATAPPRRSGGIVTDIKGLFRLGTDAVLLTTNLVEAAHSRYDPFSSRRYPAGTPTRSGGIARLVYGTINTVTSAVGMSIDLALEHIVEPLASSGTTTVVSPAREQLVAVLNGVVGDYLATQGNPLAIPMQWRVNGVTLDETMLREHVSGKKNLLVLMHGSCSTDLHWSNRSTEGHDHGAAVAKELGGDDTTVLYLLYNSGLHISDNGQLLATQMNRVAELAMDSSQGQCSPFHIYILAHSMGGLVARSACHYAATDPDTFDSHRWLPCLKKMVFLGTPHHGAMLERGGKWIDYVLSLHRFSEPFAWIGKIRSNGVTDLGYGNVRHEDWEAGHEKDYRVPTPLPDHVDCYAIAAVAASSAGHFSNPLVGDGLVTEDSALGRGNVKNPSLNLAFPSEHCETIHGVSHIGLLSSMVVYKTVKSFLVGS